MLFIFMNVLICDFFVKVGEFNSNYYFIKVFVDLYVCYFEGKMDDIYLNVVGVVKMV